MNEFPIRRSVAGDLPVLSNDLPLAFSGELTFGVGKRDETPRLAGISHLVEHLVMSRVGRVTVPHNAMTSIDCITFAAQGSPDRVADFLNRVADAINELPSITDEEIAKQRDVIIAELGEGDESAGTGPLLDRFGAVDLGLVDLGQPAHRTLTRASVLEFAATWLHAGNAVLAFSGPTPASLAVALPVARPTPKRISPSPVRETGWVPNSAVPSALSLFIEGERETRNMSAFAIEESLHDELRLDLGVIYSVETLGTVVGPERRHLTYLMDPRETDVERAALAAVGVVRRLAVDGPAPELLDRLVGQHTDWAADPTAQRSALSDAAVAFIRGEVSAAELDIMDVSRVTPDDVRTTIARALPTLLLTLKCAELSEDGQRQLDLPLAVRTPGLAGHSKLELIRHFAAPTTLLLSPRLFSGLRGHQLLVDTERIGVITPDGVIEIYWTEIALAGLCDRCGHWEITDAGGSGLVLDPAHWRGWSKAHAQIERRVPAATRYLLSGDMHSERKSA